MPKTHTQKKNCVCEVCNCAHTMPFSTCRVGLMYRHWCALRSCISRDSLLCAMTWPSLWLVVLDSYPQIQRADVSLFGAESSRGLGSINDDRRGMGQISSETQSLSSRTLWMSLPQNNTLDAPPRAIGRTKLGASRTQKRWQRLREHDMSGQG